MAGSDWLDIARGRYAGASIGRALLGLLIAPLVAVEALSAFYVRNKAVVFGKRKKRRRG